MLPSLRRLSMHRRGTHSFRIIGESKTSSIHQITEKQFFSQENYLYFTFEYYSERI